ncbi:MAG TPA: aminotransferase class V-fold PLP-dependent enzyme [Aliidongia sp.]|nr:aminotransferase class V-fold PLP-dependent enzyme [Aliidongia sp.]
MRVVTDFLGQYLDRLPRAPVLQNEGAEAFLRDAAMRQPPPEGGRALSELIEIIGRAGEIGANPASKGCLAYVPSAGLSVSAVADLISGVLNRYTGVSFVAPALVALELDVIRWLCNLMALPEAAGGILTSGGSMAAFSALLCARTAHLPEDFSAGTLYLTEQTHHSIAKAARLAGFPDRALRVVPVDGALRMDVAALQSMIEADRASGSRPFCVVASAGTTNTGVVDPLHAIADLAWTEQLWLHVDAAYGGFFQLTERGRRRLSGIERADSIVLDPHKGLSLPFGTGCLLVRDAGWLRRAHSGEDAAYLRDVEDTGLVDFADVSPELTRPNRGLRLWLPLHLHGVGAFRKATDGMLDLAQEAYRALSEIPGIELMGSPDLSILSFRCVSIERGDRATEELVRRVNDGGRFYLSSTSINDRVAARIAILNYRTKSADIDDLVGSIREIAADLAARNAD